MRSTSREIAVLLACARAHASSEDAHRIRALVQGGLDYSTLTAMADDHRMTAFLHAHLTRLAADLVPDDVVQLLHRSSRMNAARGLMLAAELLELLRLFTAAGIRALPFKGPVLAQCIYGNLALRFMRDIDILVAASDVSRARAVLMERGYETDPGLLPGPIAWRLDYQLCVRRPSDTAIVEVHWNVASRGVVRAVGIDELWTERLHTCLLGQRVPCPSHEHMLLLLCIHGGRHAWWRLELVCAVAELLRTKPLDWHRVQADGGNWRCLRMLHVGLLLAHELLAAPVPASLLDSAQGDARARGLADEARDTLFGPVPAAGRTAEPRQFQRAIQDDIAQRLRVLCYQPVISSARRAAKLMASVQRLASE